MKQNDLVQEVTMYRFAGQNYDSREEAEHAVARSDLYEFISQRLQTDPATVELVREWLCRDYEKVISLLNKFY